MCDQQSLRSACAYAQSDQSPCLSLEYSMSLELLTKQRLEFLSLKGGCTGLSEFTLVKMPHCCKSHFAAHLLNYSAFLFITLILGLIEIEQTGSIIFARVKVFRIIPEYRVLRLTFHRKSASET